MATSKGNILLIEDDAFIAGMYQTKLAMLGYTIRVASDGEEGWTMLTTEPPDLLLLDVVLPKRDGFEILAAARKDPKLQQLPILLLTNLGQKPDVQRGLELGANDYIIKAHFTPSEVVEKIEKVLRGKTS
ncbi:MAG: two-component system, OmpR family, response regulator RpaB [Parcubacteria group bacterium Gr01-1014_106]|nr:MAG: two-component system, OmpR family, response regulator RpaB [Parcubacteria group bacterium Gr01-1014_106]